MVLATVLSYGAGWAIGIPALVPVFNTAASFPFMVAALRRGDLHVAVARMLLWAMTMAVCATAIAYLRPWEAGRLFVNGAHYRDEMFGWVMTGRGAESAPSLFIPQHIRDAALFSVLSALTGGIGSMPMGAALMNFMGTYVGSLAAASSRPVLTLILGWHPWAVIRVASFVAIGVVLSAPLLSRVFKFRVDAAAARRLLIWAGAGLIVDVVLKALLAPAWQRLLLRLVGW
jgi:Ni,Fe-hydrogenase I cytochrome b subunit